MRFKIGGMKRKRAISKKHLPKGVDILFEDEDVIVVNKHPGVLTMGTGDYDEWTAYTALTEWVRKGNPKSPRRIFIVHRLDRETSGVLVFAKNEPAKRKLQEHWDETEKTYLAVTEGCPKEAEGTISSHLAESPSFKVYSVLDPAKGKLSHTQYRVKKQAGGRALLEIRLLTGRKHQIRVHLAEEGWPVAGDQKYGKGKLPGGRMGLHALTLTFNHPHTGERVSFKAEPPPWFHGLLSGREKQASTPPARGGKPPAE